MTQPLSPPVADPMKKLMEELRVLQSQGRTSYLRSIAMESADALTAAERELRQAQERIGELNARIVKLQETSGHDKDRIHELEQANTSLQIRNVMLDAAASGPKEG